MSGLPSANSTNPYWLSLQDSEPFSNYNSTTTPPNETDILIIGSGYAGTSTAYNLLKQNPNLDITMFEARTVCSGATGRNGGHLKPYCHRMYQEYEKNHGKLIAAQVVNNEVKHLYTIKNLIENEKIDCDFILTRATDIYKDYAKFEKDLNSYNKMMENPYILKEIKNSIQLHKNDHHVETMTKVKNSTVSFSYPSAHLWPWKLIISLLKKCVSKGLKLYTNSPVISVEKITDQCNKNKSKSFKVITSNGNTNHTIFAEKVIFATNAYTKTLLPSFQKAIIPVKEAVTHIISSDPIKPIPQLPNTYCLFGNSDLNTEYLINRIDGGVIVGGGSKYMIKKNNNNIIDDNTADYSETFNNMDDSYIPIGSTIHLKNYMQNFFTTWNSFKTENDYTWCGIMGFTNDDFPYVGELDFLGMENAFIIAGFSGHGMPRVYLSGKSIANCITTGGKIEKVGEIPKCYHVSKERLIKSKVFNHVYEDEIKDYLKSKL